MSQDDMNILNADGATVRNDMNANLQALASTSKGNSVPNTAYAGQHWLDDNTPSGTVWTESIYDGSDSIPLFKLDTTNNRAVFAGYQGSDIASASTINLDNATGELVDVTGTTAITAATLTQGHRRWVRFTGALTLTHGSSLVLPGGANITTAAGDYALFIGRASGVVHVLYFRASGQAVAAAPKFFAKKSSTQAIATGPDAQLIWATEEYDTNANFASNTFTPTVAGQYRLGGSLEISSAVDGQQVYISIRKNGTRHRDFNNRASGTGSQSFPFTADVEANGSTDYFDVAVNVSSASTITANATTFFYGSKLP